MIILPDSVVLVSCAAVAQQLQIQEYFFLAPHQSSAGRTCCAVQCRKNPLAQFFGQLTVQLGLRPSHAEEHLGRVDVARSRVEAILALCPNA